MNNVEAKLFGCNKELTEVGEWCIARDKKEAYQFMDSFWDEGAIMYILYVSKYLEENPGKTMDDFIEYFFIEEDPESDFTHPYGDTFEGKDTPLTKKVSQWISEEEAIPCYFCHEPWAE